MRLRLRQLEKVVAVAGEQHAVPIVSKLKNSQISGLSCEDVTQAQDFVVEFSEQVSQIVGYVLIEQELHCDSEASVICRATSRSISPRWSS